MGAGERDSFSTNFSFVWHVLSIKNSTLQHVACTPWVGDCSNANLRVAVSAIVNKHKNCVTDRGMRLHTEPAVSFFV